MSRLDKYRSAMLAAFPDVDDEQLACELGKQDEHFAQFVIDHGLGPLWHGRTGREEFRASRLAAEALYMVQAQALAEIDDVLEKAGIEYAVIKGAATRPFLYANPAVRACHDIDLLVRPEDRVSAATALTSLGYLSLPEAKSISRELMLVRDDVTLDLHWELLREGRLRVDPTTEMLSRRYREEGMWLLANEDTLFLLLVHPAFAKYLAGWDMGLHRVADVILWLRTQKTDWPIVRSQLQRNGVCAAAWATLRWVELLADDRAPGVLSSMLADLQPGRLKRAWLERWFINDLPARTADFHLLRLLGLSPFLHDSAADAIRAVAGRRRARRRVSADLDAFSGLLD